MWVWRTRSVGPTSRSSTRRRTLPQPCTTPACARGVEGTAPGSNALRAPLRPSIDIDVLVAPADVATAEEVLGRAWLSRVRRHDRRRGSGSCARLGPRRRVLGRSTLVVRGRRPGPVLAGDLSGDRAHECRRHSRRGAGRRGAGAGRRSACGATRVAQHAHARGSHTGVSASSIGARGPGRPCSRSEAGADAAFRAGLGLVPEGRALLRELEPTRW